MSGERLYDALKFTVGLRLDELRSQQQRAVTIAAADGVLLGFVATVSVGAAGMSRVLTLVALGLLASVLIAVTVTRRGLRPLSEMRRSLERGTAPR